jgi:hypothetical protein
VVDQELEFKYQQLDQLVNHWKRYFTLYRKILKAGEASPKEEHEYTELSTTFSRIYTPIATRAGIKPQQGSSVMNMVTDVPDAQAVRELSEMQRRKFENDWRSNNTDLNQKLGEFQLLREELVNTTEFAFYARRILSNHAVQWTLGLSIVVVLLGIFGVFGMGRDLLLELIKSVR